jgi:hypothetical protein
VQLHLALWHPSSALFKPQAYHLLYWHRLRACWTTVLLHRLLGWLLRLLLRCRRLPRLLLLCLLLL